METAEVPVILQTSQASDVGSGLKLPQGFRSAQHADAVAQQAQEVAPVVRDHQASTAA